MRREHKTTPNVICRSCGAAYAAALPACPYCGTMNLPAAESVYMQKLERVRDDLEGLGGIPGRETRRGFLSLRRILLIAAVLLVVATGVLYGIQVHRERVEVQQEKEEFLWQRDAFARMDEYYAAGAYDSLLEYFFRARDEGHRVWQYARSEFCDFLMDIKTAAYNLQEYEAGRSDPGWLFRTEIQLCRLESLQHLSEDERAVLMQERAPLLDDLQTRFSVTEEELSHFRTILAREGYISAEECEQFLAERGIEP